MEHQLDTPKGPVMGIREMKAGVPLYQIELGEEKTLTFDQVAWIMLNSIDLGLPDNGAYMFSQMANGSVKIQRIK